jgi:hypothetical protein
MKKLFLIGSVISTVLNLQATQIINNSNLPAQIRVTYINQCLMEGQSNVVEFALPVGTSYDVSPRSASKGRSCNETINSIDVTIQLTDGTRISKTWFPPFKDVLMIGSALSNNYQFSSQILIHQLFSNLLLSGLFRVGQVTLEFLV